MDACFVVVEMRPQAALGLAQGYLARKQREQGSNPGKSELTGALVGALASSDHCFSCPQWSQTPPLQACRVPNA